MLLLLLLSLIIPCGTGNTVGVGLDVVVVVVDVGNEVVVIFSDVFEDNLSGNDDELFVNKLLLDLLLLLLLLFCWLSKSNKSWVWSMNALVVLSLLKKDSISVFCKSDEPMIEGNLGLPK